MQRISIIAALLLLSCSVHAQITLVVKGKITDNKNNPVANASINQLGTANATVSNNKGFYAIEVENEHLLFMLPTKQLFIKTSC